MILRSRLLAIASAIIALGGVDAARGAPGVSPTVVRIGACAPLSGDAEALGRETLSGARAYLRHVNESGGVHGRRLELIALDDESDPTRTARCTRRLIEDGNVLALGFFVGTQAGAKASPIAMRAQVPIVGLLSGADLLRRPVKRWIFNVRASYMDETRTLVSNVYETLDRRDFAVFHQEDAFGRSVLKDVRIALRAYDRRPVGVATFPPGSTSVRAGLGRLRRSGADAVVLAGAAPALAEFVKLARASGWDPVFLSVSALGTERFAREAGPAGDGVVITQVVPPPHREDLPAVAAYRAALAKYSPDEEPSFVGLEGWLDALVLVEGLRRAGAEPTREGLIASIESLSDFDPGLGQPLGFSGRDHQGLRGVFPTVMRGGRALLLDDWRSLQVLPGTGATRASGSSRASRGSAGGSPRRARRSGPERSR